MIHERQLPNRPHPIPSNYIPISSIPLGMKLRVVPQQLTNYIHFIHGVTPPLAGRGLPVDEMDVIRIHIYTSLYINNLPHPNFIQNAVDEIGMKWMEFK